MNFRGKASTGDLSGFLDVGSHFEGELKFEQSFRVDGKVVGKVVSEGDLVVGERGEIDGEIHVGRLFVSGLVKGEVHASRRLSIRCPKLGKSRRADSSQALKPPPCRTLAKSSSEASARGPRRTAGR